MSVEVVVDDLPDEAVVGSPIPEAHVTATATVPDLATQGLALVGATSVEGTGKAQTRLDNAGFALDLVPDLVVAKTPVPASGPFDTIATGSTPPVSLPNAGLTTITIGNFEITLTPHKADGSETGLGTFTSPCTLKPGQSTLLYQFTVAPETTTTTTTTTTTEPTTTTTTTEPTTTTTTTEPTTTTTGPTTTTTEPTTTTTTEPTTTTTTTSPTTTTTTTTTQPTTTTTTTTRTSTTTTTPTSTTTTTPTSTTTSSGTTTSTTGTTTPTSTTAPTSTTTTSAAPTSTTTTTQAFIPAPTYPDKNDRLASTGSPVLGPLVLGGV
ncbi:DUF6801 domain-containing protein, partial [Actinosynnema sp. NPDC023658]|uniref:DUF6801 domain-containing protein n=1 Tax=Actinosynnema sp. NPDC023658 TaxID=3155465 RepID=UPI0033DAC62F